MPISKITNIEHTGSFPSEYGGSDGNLHVQRIMLEDGTVGHANSKEFVPPYMAGDEVEYTQTGEYKGTPKLRVKKVHNPDGPVAGFTGKRSHVGEMVGAAIHDAVALVCHGKAKPLAGETLDNFLCRIGGLICQASLKLKEQHSQPAQTDLPQQQYQQPQGTGRTPPQDYSRPNPGAPSPQYNPSANTGNVPIDDDEEIPF